MKKLKSIFLTILLLLSFYFCSYVNAIDILYNNISLSDALKDLAKKFSVDIVIPEGATQQTTCNIKNTTIDDALNLILCGTSFDFTKPTSRENTYLIFKTEKSNCRVGQSSRIFPLSNLEAKYVKDLLSEKLKVNARTLDEQNSIIAEGTYNDLKEIEKFILDVDQPLKQVELEVKVIEIKRNALKDIRIFRDSLSLNTLDRGIGRGQGQQIGVVVTQQVIGPPQDRGFLIGKIANGLNIFDFSANTWKIFNNQLSYLETLGLAQVHAYPKLVTISGRTATLNINQHNNLVLGSAQGVSNARGFDEEFDDGSGSTSSFIIGVASTQRVATIEAGTNLHITPTLGKENLITTMLAIDVSESSADSTRQNGVAVPTTTLRRQINTDVQIKDGQTVAIGGLVINNKSVNRRGLPFITSIPILGDLLSNRRSTKDQSELVILITPRVKDINEKSIALRKLPPSLLEKEIVEPSGNQSTTKKKRWFHFFKRKQLTNDFNY